MKLTKFVVEIPYEKATNMMKLCIKNGGKIQEFLVEHKDGNYVLYEDHLKAIAEAESAAVKKFLNKTLSFECKEVDCGECPNNDLLCGLNSVVRAYGVDEVIKKVEGL